MPNSLTPPAVRFQPTSDFTLDFRSEILRNLHRYWVSKLHGRAMPRRADIEPTEIPSLLPHIGLVGVEREPLRLFFRLVGTHITESLGRDNTGKYFDEAFQSQMLKDVMQVYGMVLQARKPVRHFGRALYSTKDFQEYESVHLPLSEDGQTVTMILIGQHYVL